MSFLSEAITSFFKGIKDIEDGVGTKAIIALTFVVVCGVCVSLAMVVPDWFIEITKVIVFTYFGASIQKSKE